MSRDPFKKMPPLLDDAEPVMGLTPEFENEEGNAPSEPKTLTQGNAPRDIFKKLSKYAIPIFVMGLFAWLILPQQRGRPLQKPQVQIDMAKQESNTHAILQQLRESSEKAQQPSEAVSKTVPSTPINPISPMQQDENTLEQEKSRRQEEVLGSPLETSNSIRLVTDEKPTMPGKALHHEQAVFSSREEQHKAAIAEHNRREQVESERNPAPPKRNMNEAFLWQYQNDGIHRPSIQQEATAEIMLTQGTIVRTALLTGVNSDMPGAVSAMVTSNVYDSIHGKHLLIPKGSKLIGVYNPNVVIGQERVVMAMQRLILPNGRWISLAGTPATDPIGHSGLKAEVDNHFWKMFATSFILGAASLLLPDEQNTITTSNIYGNGDVSAGSVAAIAMTETLNILLQRNRNITPTLTLKPGQEFAFMVARDMVMVPYR